MPCDSPIEAADIAHEPCQPFSCTLSLCQCGPQLDVSKFRRWPHERHQIDQLEAIHDMIEGQGMSHPDI